MQTPAFRGAPSHWLIAALVATLAIYWPGLHGPYLFDDYWNLLPVEQWAEGKASWLAALLPHDNGLVNSRPVAMASFMLTTKLLGVGTFSLKLGNLLVHLAIGLMGFMLLRRVLESDRGNDPAGAWKPALALTAIWLLHPLHVSTVLYAVQRMAQLGALFTLASILVYLAARRQLGEGRTAQATANLFFAFPLLVALGALSKQNAVVAPLLCLVLELAYFRKASRTRPLRLFFGLFVALPLLAGIALLLLRPQALLAGYADWDFTPWQRLLTQPRVLLDYIGMWFLPRTPRMGLYTDAFPVSTGLLSPWTTLPALLALAAVTALAASLRSRAPHVFAGWFFFLVAHSVEASILPIEMYYEHRNYLPSWGLLLMAYGIVQMLTGRIGNVDVPRLAGIGAGVVVLALGFATLGRVLVWQHEDSMTEQALRYHPGSARLHIDRISKAYRDRDYATAELSFATLEADGDPRLRLLASLEAIPVRCARDGHVDPALYAQAVHRAVPRLTVNELHGAMLQRESLRQGRCPASEAHAMARTLAAVLEQADDQPDKAENKVALHAVIAELFAMAGDWHSSEAYALAGWQQRQTLPLGVLLARAWTQTGRLREAEDLANQLDTMADRKGGRWQHDVGQIRQIIDAKRDLTPE